MDRDIRPGDELANWLDGPTMDDYWNMTYDALKRKHPEASDEVLRLMTYGSLIRLIRNHLPTIEL